MESYIEPNMGASNCQAVCEKGACVDLSGKHSAQLQCRLQILAAWMAPWYPIKTLLYRKCMQMQKLPVFLYVFIVLRQQKAFRILMQLGAASGHVHAGR